MELKKILFLTCLITLFIPTMKTKADGIGGYNTYKGRIYKDNELNFLEEKIISDNYFRLTPENWSDLKNSSYENAVFLTDWYYYTRRTYVYVNSNDYETWKVEQNLKDITLNTVIISFPPLEDQEWYINDTIPAEMASGTLIIKTEISGKNNPAYININLRANSNAGKLTLKLKKEDNYNLTVKLPVEDYIIEDITAYDINDVPLSIPISFIETYKTAGIRINDNECREISISIGSDSNETQEKINSSNDITELKPTPTIIEQAEPDIEPFETTKKTFSSYWIFYIIGCFILGVIIMFIIGYFKKKENDF